MDVSTHTAIPQIKRDIGFDENCDPNNPRKIKYDDILAASRRITGGVVRTACSVSIDHRIYDDCKTIEIPHVQCTWNGTIFKAGIFAIHRMERGVRNTLMLLSDDQKKYGVIAATSGNHGIALGYHCTQLRIPCIVVIPVNAAVIKVQKCEKMGAKIMVHGANIYEARIYALGIAKEKNMLYINGFDHPNVIEGQGSIGMEIIEQVPKVDAILCPVGGGSLITGIAIAAKHLKPDTEVYGITTDKTCSMVESLRKNERVKINIDDTLADGLAVNLVGVNTFHNLKGVVDKMIVVKEVWVARAILHLAEEDKFVVEGAGATSVAAIMAGLFPNLKGKTVVSVLSGGNISNMMFSRALERGLSAEGRLVKFKVTVVDRPAGTADICALLAGIGVTLRDIVPERVWVKGDVFSLEMKVICETNGWDHTKQLIELIKKTYKDYLFQDMVERTDKTAGTRRGPCLAPTPVCMQK